MLAKKIALGFGIAVILPMMIHYGVSTVRSDPDWTDYRVPNYKERHERASVEEQKQLEARKQELQEEYETAQRRFDSLLFFVAVPLGVLAVVVGALVSVQAIGTGLMLGGILSICDGYISYWSELTDPWRFVSLLAAFTVLIVIGYKKLDRRSPDDARR